MSLCLTLVIRIIRSQKKTERQFLSLRFEIFLQDIVSRSLLPPVPDHAGGALHHLPGLALAVYLAETGPFSQLHVAVNLDQGNAVLHAESRDELLVHGLGGLPHTTGQAVSDESLLQNLLDGGVDVHGPGGGGGGWNIISLIVRHF